MPKAHPYAGAAAFLLEEFGPPVAAVSGQVENLIVEAGAQALDESLADLQRIREAIGRLHNLVEEVVVSLTRSEADDTAPGFRTTSELRHDLRAPLNAVKGYAELLIEEAEARGVSVLIAGLADVVDSAGQLLAKIDEFSRLLEHSDGGHGETAGDAAKPKPAVATVSHALRATDGHAPPAAGIAGRILVVDDTAADRELVARRLRHSGHEVTEAETGLVALERVATEEFDLILLDMMMPGLDGFEVLQRLKGDAATRHIPVIMVSALDETHSAIRCIEAGAVDYLSKPLDPVLLHARTGTSIERKRLRDQERLITSQLRSEKELSEALLHHILPRRIVERMRGGEALIADHIPEATILFSDLVDFTALASGLAPEETVEFLDILFSRFDAIAERLGLEKIKTIGDAYMVGGGIPEPRPDHAFAIAEMGLAMHAAAARASRALGFLGRPLRLRIGIHSGPLVGRDRYP